MADMLTLDSVFDAYPKAIGLAIIITNDYQKISDRHSPLAAAEGDGKAMEDSLKALGYAIVRKHNSTLALVMSLLDQLDRIRYPPSCKRLAFVFAGHGRWRPDNGHELITNDGKVLTVNTLLMKSSPSRLSGGTLGDRVRLFFIDACRGNLQDEGKMVHRGGELAEEIRISTAPHSNMLICYSTLDGFRSYEMNGKGIWLPLVAEKLLKCDKSINDVIIDVNVELKSRFQDKKKYPFMMQPEVICRLNEQVNVFKENPTRGKQPLQGPSTKSIVHSNGYSKQKSSPPLLAATFSQLNHPSYPLQLQQQQAAVVRTMSQPVPPQVPPVLPQAPPQAPPQVPPQMAPLVPPKMPLLVPPHTVPISYAQPISSRSSPPISDTGYYRKMLNNYTQKNIIEMINPSSWNIQEIGQGQFIAELTCVLKSDKRIITGKSGYFPKKQAAQEAAAKDAIEKMEKINPIPTHPVACNSQLLTGFIHKGKLNNYYQGELRLPLPVYSVVSTANGSFKCSCIFMDPNLGSKQKMIDESSYSSKKEAEDNIAKKILEYLHKL
jgi:hypothetical protein